MFSHVRFSSLHVDREKEYIWHILNNQIFHFHPIHVHINTQEKQRKKKKKKEEKKKILEGRIWVSTNYLFLCSYNEKIPIMKIPFADVKKVVEDEPEKEDEVQGRTGKKGGKGMIKIYSKKYIMIKNKCIEETCMKMKYICIENVKPIKKVIEMLMKLSKRKNKVECILNEIKKYEKTIFMSNKGKGKDKDKDIIIQNERVIKCFKIFLVQNFLSLRVIVYITENMNLFIKPFATLEICMKIPYAMINFIIKTKTLNDDNSIELKSYKNDFNGLYVFENRKKRDEFFEMLKIKAFPFTIEKLTSEWTKGNLTNYDYLMFINILSGRSIHSISKYPIFPQVIINDYEQLKLQENERNFEKPIGYQSKTKLNDLITRKKKSKDINYLFNYHYLPSNVVKYYLYKLQDVNKEIPNFAKDFQFYESIPDFYDISNDNINLLNIKEYPSWAKSKYEFVRKLNMILESEKVSVKLNHWIDYMFGYKQKEMTDDYQSGSHDVSHIHKKENTNIFAAEVLCENLGEHPKQLFTEKHPVKKILKKVIGKEDDDEKEKEIGEEDIERRDYHNVADEEIIEEINELKRYNEQYNFELWKARKKQKALDRQLERERKKNKLKKGRNYEEYLESEIKKMEKIQEETDKYYEIENRDKTCLLVINKELKDRVNNYWNLICKLKKQRTKDKVKVIIKKDEISTKKDTELAKLLLVLEERDKEIKNLRSELRTVLYNLHLTDQRIKENKSIKEKLYYKDIPFELFRSLRKRRNPLVLPVQQRPRTAGSCIVRRTFTQPNRFYHKENN